MRVSHRSCRPCVLSCERRWSFAYRAMWKPGVLPDTIDPATLARFYATVLQGLSVQAVDGATRAELDAVVLAALRAWPA